MTSEPPRRGRRHNGLDATTYVPLADVDPRVGEHLLDVLKLAGVPAYLEPSADVEPYTRTLALPSPPTDRLWVDRSQRLAAREIIEAEVAAGETVDHEPGPAAGDDAPSHGLTDADEEQAWRQIVESFGQESAGPVPPWPVDEDAADRARPAEDEEDTRWAPAVPADSGYEDDEEDEEEDEGHYEPPPPAPLPRLSKQTVLAIGLIALGAVLLIVPGVLGFDHSTGFTLGVLSVLGAAAMLVWRLGERKSDDGPDDGAIV